LARELAECTISKQGIVVNEVTLRDYHISLAGEIILKKEAAMDGNLRECFLNRNSQFRSSFFEEVQKRSEFARMSEDELKLELRSISKNCLIISENVVREKVSIQSPCLTILLMNVIFKKFLSNLKLFVDLSSEEYIGKAVKQQIQDVHSVAQQDISYVKNKVLESWEKGSNYLTEDNRVFQEAARV
jgi:hypothetical protein